MKRGIKMGLPTAVSDAINQVFSSITGAVSIETIASILGIALASAVGFFLLWWGARKVVRMVVGAFRSGRIKI